MRWPTIIGTAAALFLTIAWHSPFSGGEEIDITQVVSPTQIEQIALDLEGSDWPRVRAAMERLRAIGPGYLQEAIERNEPIGVNVLRRVVPRVLMVARSQVSDQRGEATVTLKYLSLFPVIPVSDLMMLLKGMDPALRAIALRGLESHGAGARPAVSVLIPVLDDVDPSLRASAAGLIGSLGPTGRGVLLARLDSPNFERRNEALAGLLAAKPGELDDGDLERMLKLVMESERKSQLLLLDGLAQAAMEAPLVEQTVIRELVARLSSSDDAEKWCAAITLGKLGPRAEMARPRLYEAFVRHESNDVKAIQALGKIGATSNMVEGLVEALTHKFPNVRVSAATALGSVGPAAATALPALRRQRDLDKEDDERREAFDRAIRAIESK